MENPLIVRHLNKIRRHYDRTTGDLRPPARFYRNLLAHYYRHMIPAEASVLEVGCGSGFLLSRLPNRDVTGVDISSAMIDAARRRVPYGTFTVQAGEHLDLNRQFDCIILSDTINQAADVQQIFSALKSHAHARTRLILNFYNTLWRPILTLATRCGLRDDNPADSWLSSSDVANLLDLGGWQTIIFQSRVLLPAAAKGIERVVNRWIAPLLPWFCLVIFCVARLRPTSTPDTKCSVSVIVPARNEARNIEHVVRRLPLMGSATELVFVEGGSRDDTWQEILKVREAYPQHTIQCLRQSGQGKGNAVREGFDAASGSMLMILDADLTVPPEELPKFFRAVVEGRAELANGVRLVYPMERRAMRFLNMCGNKMFSILFSRLLSQPIKDTLCGTKVLMRKDYEVIAANRGHFGKIDPFGDFDLIFGAARLNMKIADIPIRYRERVYGQTNIDRWRHGWLLIQMAFQAARKMKFI